ncbi:hypothetical protein [Streptomyces sp. NPDC055085]
MSERASGSGVLSRWAPASDQLPGSLAELVGPTLGIVELPLYLAWSGLCSFDLSDEKLLLGMYRIVLINGRREDYVEYLNAAHLVANWHILRKMLGRGVRTAWENRFVQLRTAVAA